MRNTKDVCAGLLFAGVGALYGTIAFRSLDIGVALDMGPGYFPVLLGGALIVTGLLTLVRGLATEQLMPFGAVPWRAAFSISASILFFAVFIRKVGMFPGTLITALITCLSRPIDSLTSVIFTSLAIAAFCTAVFSLGLGLPIPMFGSWQ